MDGGNNDLNKFSYSIRQSSARFWSNDGSELFSRSARNEDDEQALQWAALEKLPTYSRLKKGLLTGSQGAHEIDISNLGFDERQELIDKLVKVADVDNEKFLRKIKERMDRVGIENPKIEVRFEHLNVETEVYVGSRALPSFFNFLANIIEGLLNYLHLLPSRKKHLNILNDVSGIVKPNRLTLLLGPPSSGKTSLLLALAGKLDKDLKVTGNVTYNGHKMNEFVPLRSAAYISQNDVHIGEMTVRETLAFSARCQGVGSRYDMLAELSRREKAANIKPDHDLDVYMKAAATEGQEASLVADYVLKVLGLEVCADTMVGNEMLRGISGGQKKRVTTGEMLVGPAKALFMDEISTGLDSATTYQIVKSLGHYVHIVDGTAVISLLQPAPETYDLFDDIILLSDSQIVYQGPREFVLEFFESMGFRCPERKGVADFLQEVTSKKDQQQYWLQKDQPYRFVTAKEFAIAFQIFHVGKKLEEELATSFDKSKSHPAALSTKQYGVNKKELLKACTSREYLLMQRSSFVYIFKLSQLIFMAAITMTLFFRTKMHRNTITDGLIYTGALFFTVIVIMFNGMAEIAMTVSKLPIFYKQRDLLFYPSWAYALPSWILKIPITFIEVAAWVSVTYYVVGYDPNVGRFFKQYFILIFLNQMASGLFRLIGALGRSMTIANTGGSFVLLVFFALGGFVLARNDVKDWWKWGYWCSPMMYAQNAILVNEFNGHSWKKIPEGQTETLGDLALKSRGFFPYPYWYWIGTGALLGFILIFNLAVVLALTYLNPLKSQAGAISEDSQADKDDTSSANGVEMKGRNISFAPESTDRPSPHKKKGMILPFEQHCLTFDQVVYSVDMPQEMKCQGVANDRLVLLKGVSGAFRPGVLTALMGVSGAGKTTLMDVLAGRKTGGYIEGNINISGFRKKQETFARISGYCEQNDIHSPYVTVYESLLYSAWLRLPGDVKANTRKMFIEEIMELVELNSLKNALVGLPGVDGLSTEQRKRLTIAVELVANPSIIFMDEPTSGLDARAAAIVMRTVRNTVDTGRTVVCTIHQPSIDIFEAFDEGIAGVNKITDGYNPATWMLEITSSAQEIVSGVDFAEVYKNSEVYRRNKELIYELNIPSAYSKEVYFPSQYSQPFFIQCLACLSKQRWSYWRNTQYTAVRFLFTTAIALMFGSMFWGIGSKYEKQQDLSNAMGSMYSAVVFIGIQNASAVQPVVAIERTVFYREKAAGMYSSLPYALAQALIEIPYIFFQAVVYGIIVYAMIGFEWSAAKFFWYLFFMYFTLLYFTYYGMMTVAVSPNQQVAAIIATAFYGLWNVFSGFIIPRTRIPIWWRWYYWLCPVAWTLYGMVVSQYGDISVAIHNDGRTVKDLIEQYLGFKHDFLGVVAAVVVAFAILFGFAFALSIRAINFQKR